MQASRLHAESEQPFEPELLHQPGRLLHLPYVEVERCSNGDDEMSLEIFRQSIGQRFLLGRADTDPKNVDTLVGDIHGQRSAFVIGQFSKGRRISSNDIVVAELACASAFQLLRNANFTAAKIVLDRCVLARDQDLAKKIRAIAPAHSFRTLEAPDPNARHSIRKIPIEAPEYLCELGVLRGVNEPMGARCADAAIEFMCAAAAYSNNVVDRRDQTPVVQRDVQYFYHGAAYRTSSG